MAMDDRTAQAQLTPEERRALLRAFADRMLLKITAMDDPEDLPGVEKAVRVAAVIERVYSRCDRAERQRHIEVPDLFKAEAECATHKSAAIKARVDLANMLEWENKRRRALGPWWDAAEQATQSPTPVSQVSASPAPNSPTPTSQAPERPAPADTETPEALMDTSPDTDADTTSNMPDVIYVDYTDDILEAQADYRTRTAKPPPPS